MESDIQLLELADEIITRTVYIQVIHQKSFLHLYGI
jgi:hypothetical protein